MVSRALATDVMSTSAPVVMAPVVSLELHRHRCAGCGLLCRCTTHVAGELAVFECHPERGGCGTRYYVGYGAAAYLHAEPIGEA